MAKAADYLQLSQTQLVVPYKLRSRAVGGVSLTATNISTNYTLSADISSDLEGVTITPSSIKLAPNGAVTITVTLDSAQLEVYPAGVLSKSLKFLIFLLIFN